MLPILYRKEDLKAIKDRLSAVVSGVNLKKNESCFSAKAIIRQYLKDNNRIVYGGTAYQDLLVAKKKAGVHADGECADIDFYTPDPLHDIERLCLLLNSAGGYEMVEARDTFYKDAFVIFVNFTAVCNVTYLHPVLFAKMECITVNGMRYPKPDFLLLDVFRMFNDPMHSFWRLKEKNVVERALQLLDSYPMVLESGPLKMNMKKSDVFRIVKDMKSLIHLDTRHFGVENDGKYVVVSSNLHEDVGEISRRLKKPAQWFRPFGQLWDNRAEIGDDVVVLGDSQRCVPYLDSDGVKYGTFMVTFNYYMILKQYCIVYGIDSCDTQRIMRGLLDARLDFLKKKKKTIMDDTIFREFVSDCQGRGRDLMKDFRRQTSHFKYRHGWKMPDIHFDNFDGGKISL